MKAMGGKKDFEIKLDELFSTTAKLSGRDQADVTGLIGQYAHGNEPSHHIAYLYNFTNAPDKTQYYVNKILREQYSDKPDGLSGNEDCGQMSAWYLMSSFGYLQYRAGAAAVPGWGTAVREYHHQSGEWQTFQHQQHRRNR
jgi:putative alpha-1,2-mannosidase